MDSLEDIDETARSFFLAKIANGKLPQVLVGGEQDGLRYFTTEIDGTTYWLTEDGLMVPLTETPLTENSNER
jgi:uncharacterized protein YqjF (DUF2071 family)